MGNDKEKEASPDWPPPPPPQFHIYRRRWLMLAMFAVVSGMNGFHWIHYPIIGSIIKHFYDITDDQVNWVSLSFMLGYPILFFPGAWICQKIGLRYTVIAGSVSNAVAMWVKLAATAPDRYYLVIIGQILATMGNVCLLGLPPSVAAAWFGPDQVSSACAIGVFGNQFGIALGFLLPPIFIHDHENKGEIAQDINHFFYYVGGIMTAFSLLTILFYRESRLCRRRWCVPHCWKSPVTIYHPSSGCSRTLTL